MKRLVVDASVAMKWVIEEPGTADALLLRRVRLAAPDLLVADCAAVLWKKLRRAELSMPEAILAARLLERSAIELMPMHNLLESATRIAMALDHPAYDCMYLALADALGCALVTADERLCRKASATASGPQIIPLEMVGPLLCPPALPPSPPTR